MSKSGAAARLRRPWMLATEPSTEFMRCMSEARSAPSYRAHSTSSCRHSLTQNWSSSGSGGCGGCGTSSSSSSSPLTLCAREARPEPAREREGLREALFLAAGTCLPAFQASTVSCNLPHCASTASLAATVPTARVASTAPARRDGDVMRGANFQRNNAASGDRALWAKAKFVAVMGPAAPTAAHGKVGEATRELLAPSKAPPRPWLGGDGGVGNGAAVSTPRSGLWPPLPRFGERPKRDGSGSGRGRLGVAGSGVKWRWGEGQMAAGAEEGSAAANSATPFVRPAGSDTAAKAALAHGPVAFK
mmetsp:Transcript_13410/g.30657  ORF Transcript_13410/g.30657 Transcript_13410/m.30657 type:complete len:304 (-) Transcript_13410:74-985(-)